MPNPLSSLLHAQKSGQSRGITSICSAHPYVLATAMRQAARTGAPLLIEATCNQVNQFGGYTGLTPADFVKYIRALMDSNGLPFENLLLGGDHLGPSVWQNEPAASAMPKAEQLVSDYVRAGFTKIHLDASMKLADDDSARPLDVELSARRAAQLAKAAESARPSPDFGRGAGGSPTQRGEGLSYVIGTEVPIPGGAQAHEERVKVTSAENVRETLEATRAAFRQAGLEFAWERVIAVVVQPGVEFGDDFVLDYAPPRAAELARFIESQPNLIYEAHSTDYQTRAALQALVRDHFAILKVGPGLTFAFREAVFALARMEAELLPAAECSNMIAALEDAMLRHPGHWQKHYHGSPAQQAFARQYSLSDRLRYYWPEPGVQAALERLLRNLERQPLPLALISQFAPAEYIQVRSGEIENTPRALIASHISRVLDDYAMACRVL